MKFIDQELTYSGDGFIIEAPGKIFGFDFNDAQLGKLAIAAGLHQDIKDNMTIWVK